VQRADATDEAIAAAVDRLNVALFLAAIAERLAGGHQAACQRRLADEPIAPYVIEELGLGDDALAMLYKIGKNGEHLRLDRNRRTILTQLEQRGVQLEAIEGVDHGAPRAGAVPGVPVHGIR
jgi:hypothetical protein